MACGGLKWHILLRAQGIDVRFRSVLRYTFVGVFFNNFLPANVGGDVMRGYGLARDTDRAAESAVSVVVDRLVGLLAFMSAAFVVGPGGGLPGRAEPVAGHRARLGAGLALAGDPVRRAAEPARAGLVERLFQLKWFARLAPFYHRLSDALTAYRFKFPQLVLAFCVSLLTLAVSNFAIYAVALALGGRHPTALHLPVQSADRFRAAHADLARRAGPQPGRFRVLLRAGGRAVQVSLPVSVVMQIIIYITSLPGGVLWWRCSETATAAASRE